MLVRHHSQGWKIISHYTHALLAGKIGSCLSSSLRLSHWPETLTAIINHDDKLSDFGASDYLTDAGSPLDFIMDDGDDNALEHAKELHKTTLQKSQWIALLVSRHLEFLNENSPEPEMKTFLKEMYDKRKEQRKLYGINLEQEDHLYSLIRFCDRLSLILCGEEVPAGGRELEINTSINNDTYYISSESDKRFKISPWVFETDEFKIDFEYKILEQLKFSSNKELEESIAEALPKLQKITLCK